MYGVRVKGKAGLGLRAGIAALALAFGASLVTAPAMAQDKKAPAKSTAAPKGDAKGAAPAGKGDEKEQSAWIKLCEKAPNITDPKQELNVCLTHHERLDGNTGRVLVSAAIREVEGQDKKALMVMVPLGMALPPGIQVKVDENEPLKLQYTLCHAAGCTAETEATPAVIEQMKKGKQVIVAAINLAGKAIGFPVPLVGFEQALAGKPVDNEKYKEARQRLMQAIYQRQVELAKKAKEEEEAKGKETKKQ
jgi:invasion protein IalB